MRALRFLSIAALATALSGCGALFKTESEWQPQEWSPSSVSISCSDPSRCPDHQGVLFSYKATDGGWSIERCTASLYEPDRILSAGHCRQDGARGTFFLTASRPGRPSRLVAASYETGAVTDDVDYASFRLAESLGGRAYLRPVDRVPIDSSRMVALVVNGDLARLHLDAVDCNHVSNVAQRRTIGSNPSKFVVQDCTIVRGNSGGALVRSDDLNSAYGVLVSVPTAAARAYGQTLGLMSWANATNMRCLGLPGWPQVDQCH